MIADVFTKALQSNKFGYFRDALLGLSEQSNPGRVLQGKGLGVELDSLVKSHASRSLSLCPSIIPFSRHTNTMDSMVSVNLVLF
jgi:hypothetical protein